MQLRSENVLAKSLSRTIYAVPNNDSRAYLNGLLLDVKDGQLTLVGTDGHRIAVAKTAATIKGDDGEFILPRKTAVDLARLVGDSDQTVTIAMSSTAVRFSFGDFALTARAIDGRFPNWRQVMRQAGDEGVVVSVAALRGVLQRVSILTESKFQGARFAVGDNGSRLLLESTNQGQEQSVDEITVSPINGHAPKDIEVGFNIHYLTEVCGAMGGENCRIDWIDSSRGFLISDPQDSTTEHLVMPMKL